MHGAGPTGDSDFAYQQRISDGVNDALNSRAIIEQAKGALAVIYGLEEDRAFELLAWVSQRTNVKLRTLAERVVVRCRALSAPTLPARAVYDKILISAHQQGDSPDAGQSEA